MDQFYMDSLTYLQEAYDGLREFQPIDEFCLLFEADNSEVAEQVEKNNKAANKATSGLKKAIEAIRNFIKNLLDSVTSFFKKRFASKEEREAFKDFVAAVKADPNLKNKKVSYNDYTKVMKEYEATIADAEKVDRALAEGKQADAEKCIRRLTELTTGSAKGVATSIGVNFIENVASSDALTAKAIAVALRSDSSIIDNIEKSIGEKNANAFVKDINALAGTRLSIRRLIVKLRQKQYKTMSDGIDDLYSSCSKTFSSKWSIMASTISPRGALRRATGNKEIQSILKGNDEESKLIKNTIKGSRSAKRSAAVQGTADALVGNVVDPINDKLNTVSSNMSTNKLKKLGSKSKSFWGIKKKDK